MTEAEIYAFLTEVFQDQFMREDITLKPQTTAQDVPGWDSFKQMEIILAAEKRFDIKLNTRDIDSLRNIGDLVRVVMTKAE